LVENQDRDDLSDSSSTPSDSSTSDCGSDPEISVTNDDEYDSDDCSEDSLDSFGSILAEAYNDPWLIAQMRERQ